MASRSLTLRSRGPAEFEKGLDPDYDSSEEMEGGAAVKFESDLNSDVDSESDEEIESDSSSEPDLKTMPKTRPTTGSKSKSRATPFDLVVLDTTPMPKGYVFVRRGNPYLTRNCRSQALADGKDVWTVVSQKGQSKIQLGIRVPGYIYFSVRRDEAASRADRERAVRKRDDAYRKKFKEAIMEEFPGIPPDHCAQTVQQATKKKSGRVGRVGKLDLKEKARRAVSAHIRHCKTRYEDLLKNGIERHQARADIESTLRSIYDTWRKKPMSIEEAAAQFLQKKTTPPKSVKKQGPSPLTVMNSTQLLAQVNAELGRHRLATQKAEVKRVYEDRTVAEKKKASQPVPTRTTAMKPAQKLAQQRAELERQRLATRKAELARVSNELDVAEKEKALKSVPTPTTTAMEPTEQSVAKKAELALVMNKLNAALSVKSAAAALGVDHQREQKQEAARNRKKRRALFSKWGKQKI